jgi:hypothetical protein
MRQDDPGFWDRQGNLLDRNKEVPKRGVPRRSKSSQSVSGAIWEKHKGETVIDRDRIASERRIRTRVPLKEPSKTLKPQELEAFIERITTRRSRSVDRSRPVTPNRARNVLIPGWDWEKTVDPVSALRCPAIKKRGGKKGPSERK